MLSRIKEEEGGVKMAGLYCCNCGKFMAQIIGNNDSTNYMCRDCQMTFYEKKGGDKIVNSERTESINISER